MTAPPLQPRRLVEILDRHHVEYVLIGGFAAAVRGAQRPTEDIDITPSTTTENLGRLVTALREMRAGIRVNETPEGLPFNTSVEGLRGMKMLNLRTPYGDIDLTFEPNGTGGFEDLTVQADPRDIEGVIVRVAALEDIIRSKEAAGRQKDAEALPELYRLARSRRGDA